MDDGMPVPTTCHSKNFCAGITRLELKKGNEKYPNGKLRRDQLICTVIDSPMQATWEAEAALAFSMGTHARLGSAQSAAPSEGSKRWTRLQKKDKSKGCAHLMMPDDLVKRVVEAAKRPRSFPEAIFQITNSGLADPSE